MNKNTSFDEQIFNFSTLVIGVLIFASYHPATMDFPLRRRQKRRLKFFERYQMATTETRSPYCRKGKRIIARGCDSD